MNIYCICIYTDDVLFAFLGCSSWLGSRGFCFPPLIRGQSRQSSARGATRSSTTRTSKIGGRVFNGEPGRVISVMTGLLEMKFWSKHEIIDCKTAQLQSGTSKLNLIIPFHGKDGGCRWFFPLPIEIDRRFFGPSSHLPAVCGETTLVTVIFRPFVWWETTGRETRAPLKGGKQWSSPNVLLEDYWVLVSNSICIVELSWFPRRVETPSTEYDRVNSGMQRMKLDSLKIRQSAHHFCYR